MQVREVRQAFSLHVRDLMTRNVHHCGPGQPASDAARAMWDFDIGCVPVVDAQWQPLGMITDRDICMATYTRGRPPSDIRVIDAMSPEIFTCAESDTLATAERIMRERQVRRLPVVDEQGKLVGLLSLNDIALARASSPTAKMKERMLGDVADTLAAVCRHRESPAGGQL